MKKTSFFYSLKFMLLILLAWMLLLDEAVRLNMRQEINQSEEAEKAAAVQAAAEEPAASVENSVETAKTSTADETGQDMIQGAEEGETFRQEPQIRVLLMDTGYQSYYHQEVTVMCDGNEVTYTPASPELQESPVILTQQEGGIEVTSIERQQGHPFYQGNLEIRNTGEGLLLINELSLETYLEAVVPSEMPSNYEEEALKAQAVCARTYVCRQMQEERLKEYGADVDDSVNFQVYENIAPQESTTAAVRATAGQILCQDGEPIQAYYFSTSAGATSTDEIWGADQAASYLKAVVCEFDQEEPWSSWSVTLPWGILAERSSLYPLDEENDTTDDSGSFGGLKQLEITRKNQSGAVTGLHVVTNAGSFDLTEEYSIRQFLAPSGCDITEKDGSVTEGGALLPSAYFTMETVPGESVTIQGGGFGHGVGMSQTAANKMAVQGYTCEEILDYFFKNVDLCLIEDVDME